MAVYSSDGSNSSPTGNGPAGAAFVIDGKDPHYFPMPNGTNNEAEMRGMVEAVLHAAQRATTEAVVFKTDSQWVAYTVAGYLNLPNSIHYKLATKNRERFEVALATIQAHWREGYALVWVRREQNKEADRAANIARQKAIELYATG